MVAVILLNWNNSRDTLECLRSLISDRFPHKRIIVVDNDSSARDYENLIAGIRGMGNSFREIREEEIEEVDPSTLDDFLIVVKNRENYGFAGGNNRGIKLALKFRDVKYLWLLNNDTVVKDDTLLNLVKRIEKDNRTGFVGSVLLYFSYPDKIQAVGGGKFYPWFGSARLIMKGKSVRGRKFRELREEEVLKRINYIMGASLMVRREVIEQAGLLDEVFFLYGEEVDWQLRGRKKGWKTGVSLDSYVYHKVSGTVKSRSSLYRFHMMRSSTIVILRHYSFLYLGSALIFQLLYSLAKMEGISGIKDILKGFGSGLREYFKNRATL